jgi:hypothetical protein
MEKSSEKSFTWPESYYGMKIIKKRYSVTATYKYKRTMNVYDKKLKAHHA